MQTKGSIAGDQSNPRPDRQHLEGLGIGPWASKTQNKALARPLPKVGRAAASRSCFQFFGRLALLLGFGLIFSVQAAQAAEEVSETPPATEMPAADSPAAVPAMSLAGVENMARQLAQSAYQAQDERRAETLRSVDEDRWNSIVFNDERRLWREAGLPFEIGLFHPGFIFDQVVSIDEVTETGSGPVAFSPDSFELGDQALADKLAPLNLNYAGFRIYYPINDGARKDEVAVFLGGTHFRAVARKSDYGLTARGLILNPAQSGGEEIPYFRRFWLVRPEPEATSLTLFALLDSPSLTGAYQFVIKPGTSTVMEVKARLFKRNGERWPRKIGLAPMGSMYLFSEKENGSRQDWRPEVHNSDTLLMASGRDNWLMRPLVNPERLAIENFDLSPPRGFGLMQRDDNFDHYQDLAARFERRSSLWAELLDKDDKGRLELIEIPATRDYNDNILAFWVPERLNPDSTADPNATSGTELAFAYRLYWMAPGVTPHQLGRAASTRLAVDAQKENAEFIIDFESEDLNAIPAETGLASQIETGEDYPVVEKSLRKNPVTGGWRLSFKVKLSREKGMVESLMSVGGERPSPRFKARLIKGENLPEALTETWVYDWPQ